MTAEASGGVTLGGAMASSLEEMYLLMSVLFFLYHHLSSHTYTEGLSMQKSLNSAAVFVCLCLVRCPPQWLQQRVITVYGSPALLWEHGHYCCCCCSAAWDLYETIIEQMVDNGAERPNKNGKSCVCSCVRMEKGGRVPTPHGILSSPSDRLCTVWCVLSVTDQ